MISSGACVYTARYSYRLLDLFCGEGLAAWGYWLSGRFSEIVGVDINPENRDRYSFDFVQGDAMKLDYEFLMQFDFIHASPPCQFYSKATPDRSKHPRLIPGVHHMLFAVGKPFVIENVEGSGKDLRPNLVMNGHGVGIPSDRRRYFHVSTLDAAQRLIKSGRGIRVHGGLASRSDLIQAMGLNVISRHRLKLLTMHGIEQGIPPAFTQHIAEMVLPHKIMIGERASNLSASHVSNLTISPTSNFSPVVMTM